MENENEGQNTVPCCYYEGFNDYKSAFVLSENTNFVNVFLGIYTNESKHSLSEKILRLRLKSN